MIGRYPPETSELRQAVQVYQLYLTYGEYEVLNSFIFELIPNSVSPNLKVVKSV